MNISKRIRVIAAIAGIFFLYSRCVNTSTPVSADPRGEAYAGSQACMQCHTDVYNSYQHTNHFKTSWDAISAGSQIAAGDTINFDNNTAVKIERRDSGIFQVAYIKGKELMAKSFDIGFGSGEKASSFGYWQDKKLFQLPLSYFVSIHGWANSPGFPSHRANFERPIIRRCFECHSSNIAEEMHQAESLTQLRQLDQKSIIYGIDCERCHGPASEHVKFQTANPSVKEARYIGKWLALSRQQKLDACGMCHSGNDLTTLRSTFDFRPGDILSKFYYPEFAGGSAPVPDVHGKQVQLLQASQCFLKSSTMECASCHNVHQPALKNISEYSKQCTNCHQQSTHKNLFNVNATNADLLNNCIDCHMPKVASRLISFQVMGKEKVDSYLLRTHRIAIYPMISQKIMAQIKQAQK